MGKYLKKRLHEVRNFLDNAPVTLRYKSVTGNSVENGCQNLKMHALLACMSMIY